MNRPQVTPEYLRDWGRHARGSPLYSHLTETIATDDELLGLINRIEHVPAPNVLFAAVHMLLLGGEAHPLADFYASLVDEPRHPGDAAGPFRDFALGHQEAIVEMGRTRYTQTNECRRCVALLAGVWATGVHSFHMVEIGASAGLNLIMDRYRYRWGDVTWGPESPVQLTTTMRGGSVHPQDLEILSRTGLDLAPIDASEEGDRSWLVALTWPEHRERRARLRHALEMAAQEDLRMVPGDATETLGDILADMPGDQPIVILNSLALMQFDRSQRDRLAGVLAEAGAHRVLRRVSLELQASGDEGMTLSADLGAGLAQLGQAHPHGEWLELYDRP